MKFTFPCVNLLLRIVNPSADTSRHQSIVKVKTKKKKVKKKKEKQI